MRIGIFSELYLPTVGGQEIRYAELASSLLQLGHTVDVYSLQLSRDHPTQETLDGVSVYRYPLAENYRMPRIKALRRRVFPLLVYAIWVRKMAVAENYDLMIFNQWPLAHIAFARRDARAKSVLDWCEVRGGSADRLFLKWLPRFPARNMAVSQAVADAVRSASGVDAEYIPSGVWVSTYRCSGREERSGLIYLGRITAHKNVELLVDAYGMMKQAGYQGTLTIAGPDAYSGQLARYVNASPYAKDIYILGFIDDQTKRDLLANAEALAISSRREGFPRVVAEAMASGLPVATVDFPENGTKTVVRDYQIGVVTAPEASALCAGIYDVLQHWESYSARCLQASQELDWSLLVSKLLHPSTSEVRGKDGTAYMRSDAQVGS